MLQSVKGIHLLANAYKGLLVVTRNWERDKEEILPEKDQQEPDLPTPSFPTFNLRRVFLNGFLLQRRRLSTHGLLRVKELRKMTSTL